MFKPVFAFLGLLFLSQISLGSVSCNGYVLFPSNSVMLNCTNGYCTGWTNSQSVSTSGDCGAAGSFSAYGTSNATMLSGYCNNGMISLNLFSANVALQGGCSAGGSFYGSVYSPAGYGSGSCQQNGMSSVYFSGGQQQISGYCSQP